MIDRALAQAVRWQRMEERPRVFVNLAAEQLRVASLPDEVAQLALRYGVPPEDICFEVSERSLDADLAALREQLLLLRGHGFGLALDDFGAGNTALSWLPAAAARRAQADRRFTATVEDPTAQAIIRAIVDLGPALGVTTVAEGVESPSQLATLRRLGCDFAQGYEFAEPQSARAASPSGSGGASRCSRDDAIRLGRGGAARGRRARGHRCRALDRADHRLGRGSGWHHAPDGRPRAGRARRAGRFGRGKRLRPMESQERRDAFLGWAFMGVLVFVIALVALIAA